MQMLNTTSFYPGMAWAVVRFLAAEGKPTSKETITTYLEPGQREAKKPGPVHHILNDLKSLGLTAEQDANWSLTGGLEKASMDDYPRFQRAVRAAVLGVGGEVPDPPQDIRRALAWMLTRDPYTEAFNWPMIDKSYNSSAPDGELILTNDTRWTPLAVWGTALGLLAPAAHVADHYVPDCTQAVRQVLSDGLERGRATDAMSVLHLLRRELPVLPGGTAAVAARYTHPDTKVAGAALSFALARGEYEGWLELTQYSDASSVINIHDPDRASARICSSVTLLEGEDD